MNTETELYRRRRKNLIERIGEGLILISSSEMSPETDLADKNLAYLTGVHDRNAYLLLAPRGVRVELPETRSGPELSRGRVVHEILFVTVPSPQDAFMNGPGRSLDEIKQSTGVDRVYDHSILNRILQSALMTTEVLWLNTPSVPSFGKPLSPGFSLIGEIRERYYWLQLKNIAPVIHQMRFVKDEFEVASLRQAFEIQTAIFEKIMRALKPGESEALGQAIFDYETRTWPSNVTHGMDRSSYDATIIVGTGAHAAIPHYMGGDTIIQDGDLVLIDTGVAVNGYSSDITRTFPANGRFTPGNASYMRWSWKPKMRLSRR